MYSKIEFIPVLYLVVDENISDDVFESLSQEQKDASMVWKKARIRKDFIVSYRQVKQNRTIIYLHNNDSYKVSLTIAELDEIFLK
jgi:hypothetical protein